MTERTIQLLLFSWCRAQGDSLAVPNFYLQWENDLFAVTKKNRSREFEIKISKADFKNDQHKIKKHEAYRKGDARVAPNQFYYVFPDGMVALDDVPCHAGVFTISVCGKLRHVRRAPKLHSEPVPPNVILRAYRSMMHRYWNIRKKL